MLKTLPFLINVTGLLNTPPDIFQMHNASIFWFASFEWQLEGEETLKYRCVCRPPCGKVHYSKWQKWTKAKMCIFYFRPEITFLGKFDLKTQNCHVHDTHMEELKVYWIQYKNSLKHKAGCFWRFSYVSTIN